MDDADKAWAQFYQAYGEAMLAWSTLESELATVFSFLTNIPPDMAIQLYYSARSFTARMDLFKAGLTASGAPAELKSFARGLITQAKKYSEYRNKFAHDQPLLSQHGHPAQFTVLMVDGRGQFQPPQVKKKYIESAVPVDDIGAATRCFRQLASLTRDFWARHMTRTASLGTLRAQLREFPTLPPAKGQSPPSAKPKRRRPQSQE